MSSTPCECPLAGYCERHQCTKSEVYYQKCKTRVDWFIMWEEKRGPGQPRPTGPVTKVTLPEPPRATAEQLPCPYRGAQKTREDGTPHTEECKLCGGKTLQIPIYSCNKFNEPCSIGRWQSGKTTMRSCLGCEVLDQLERL